MREFQVETIEGIRLTIRGDSMKIDSGYVLIFCHDEEVYSSKLNKLSSFVMD